MNRALTLFGLLACLALVAAGCGGSDDDDGSTNASSDTAAVASNGGDADGGGDDVSSDPGSDDASGGDEGSGSDAAGSGPDAADDGSSDGPSGEETAVGTRGGSTGLGANGGSKRRVVRNPAAASAGSNPAAGFETTPGGDNSIQEFGTEATGAEKTAVVNAMFSFFGAMANSDYPGICAGLTSANVEQLEMFLKLKDKQGSCATVLAEILNTQAPEARKALNGTVYQVREEDGNAFILFTPQGGAASYFVMKNENGAWKSTSVTVGTPLNPGA